MVLGAVMLVDSPAPELQLGWGFIVSTVAGLAVITTILAKIGISAQLAPPVTGRAGMVDTVGETLSSINPGRSGRVSTHGEIWEARSDEEIGEGEPVRVVAVDGLRLTVRREGTHPSGGSHS
jgi:membrane-bound serine protease (ClpP class)